VPDACAGTFSKAGVAVGQLIGSAYRHIHLRAWTHVATAFRNRFETRAGCFAGVCVGLTIGRTHRHVNFRAVADIANTRSLHGDPVRVRLAAIAVAASVHAANRVIVDRTTGRFAGAEARYIRTCCAGKADVVVSVAIQAANRLDVLRTTRCIRRTYAGGCDLDPGAGRQACIAVGVAVRAANRVEIVWTSRLAGNPGSGLVNGDYALAHAGDLDTDRPGDTIVAVGFAIDATHRVVLHRARYRLLCLGQQN